VAFAVSAGLFGLGVVLAIVLLPSKLRLQQLREAASAAQAGMAAPSQAQADPDRLTRTADLDG
jgi:prolyl-tRNA editing enzyme YbaK/EbsC (Cys-tRNA(Pro) deacylase)